MKKIILFIILVIPFFAQAQFTDRYWTFGDSAAIDFRNLNAPIPAQSVLRARGTCASICDSAGNLLFYSGSPHVDLWEHPGGTYNYGYIINKNHQIMENGDSLASQLGYQEMIIVPDPGNANQFYVFTAGILSPITGFYYNKIDLSYNNGLGKVIQKNVQLQTFKVNDGLAAVKHGNGKDWWVVMKMSSNTSAVNTFYFYLVNSTGISGPFLQSIGSPVRYGDFLRLKFSKNGNKLVAMTPGNLFETYDFDRCTGLLSSVKTIHQHNINPPYKFYWSFALSSSGERVYALSEYNGPNQDSSYVVQYNLNASNILNSADTLHTFIYPELGGLLQRGPDDKIYIATGYWVADCDVDYLYCDTTRNYVTNNLSVINSPDSLGAACDFQAFSFNLGGHRTYLGLPNNPNYELGPDSGSVCDTLGHVGLNELLGVASNLFVFYNPSWQKAFINAEKLKGKNYVLIMYDITGREVFKEVGSLEGNYFTKGLEMNQFSTGLYIISLSTEKEKLVKKFLKN